DHHDDDSHDAHDAGDDHEKGGAHDDADDDGHHHGRIDQHLWLDPVLVKRMIPILSEAVRNAQTSAGLGSGAPGAGASSKMGARVDDVDAAYRDRLASLQGRAIVTDHNAW